MSTDFKTPIGAVRGLGAARAGTEHHIRQRVSAIALVFLVPWFLYAVIAASRSGFEGATAFLSQPWNAILMILGGSCSIWHFFSRGSWSSLTPQRGHLSVPAICLSYNLDIAGILAHSIYLIICLTCGGVFAPWSPCPSLLAVDMSWHEKPITNQSIGPLA